MRTIRIIAIICLLNIGSFVYGQATISKKYFDLIKKAENYYHAKNYKTAAITYSQAFKLNNWAGEVNDRYNAACAWALAKEKDSAFYHLNYIVKNRNYLKYDVISKDVDLKNLHNDKRWEKLLKEVQLNIEKKEKKLNRPLMLQLDSIYEVDQGYRIKMKEKIATYGINSKEVEEFRSVITYYDSLNLIRVKHIIDTYGWLGEDEIGQNGSTTLFLVIQHSDLATQKEYLPIMREAVKNEKAYKQQLALLEDRIALGEGRKQIYGSQIIKSTYTGKDTLAPVEDFKSINKRRWEMDLGSIEEYLKNFNIVLPKNKPDTNNDFDTAIEITDSIYGPTNVGVGYGKTLDFNFNASYREQNSAWFKFSVSHDTSIVFDIVSQNPADDYDFIIFKCNNPTCIEDIRSNKIKPDRWCFNDNNEKTGYTGLSVVAKDKYISTGPFSSHVAAIDAKAGDTFYLMVTYNYGKQSSGFTIYFYDYWTKKPNKLKRQTEPVSLNNSDCINANNIIIRNGAFYKSTNPPKGSGKIQEQLKQNNNDFAEEHNSAWHVLSIENEGELEFKISPIDSTNDYDFILYPYTDSTICKKLVEEKIKPLRSNLSNIKKSNKGITGIEKTKRNNDIKKGIGDPFSKSVPVKKGEKYILYIDNVTPNGKGYTIQFDISRKIKIKGQVSDSDNKSVVADIELYDEKGTQLEKTQSQKNGTYEMDAYIKEGKNYYLTISSDSTFIETKTINSKNVSANGEYPNIKTVLPKLKKGEKYKLGNIVFYGDMAELLPSSIPSVDALANLMKKNKKMSIQIEGHTNGEDWHLSPEYQNKKEKELSTQRAQKIYDILVSKGIEKSRLSIVGLGSTMPLFPQPKDETESSANRRVEIRIISIK